MTTISDASGDLSTLWPWWVWVCLVCGLGFAWLVWSILRAPIEDVDASTLDDLDGAGRIGDRCRRSGHCYRLDPTGAVYTCLRDGCEDSVKRFPENRGRQS